jgi:cytidine deaminase
MKIKIDQTKHVCNEELVTSFVDNRMNDKEQKEYIKKIETCPTVRKCSYCKQLIDDFLSLKKTCFHLKSGLAMPKKIENNLLNSIRKSFQSTKR